MNRSYYTRPKSSINFESQTEKEIRTDLEQKISINILKIREHR